MSLNSFKLIFKWSNFEASGQRTDLIKKNILIRSSDYRGYHPHPEEQNWDKIYVLPENRLAQLHDYLQKEKLTSSLSGDEEDADKAKGPRDKGSVTRSANLQVVWTGASTSATTTLTSHQRFTKLKDLQDFLQKLTSESDVKELSVEEYEAMVDREAEATQGPSKITSRGAHEIREVHQKGRRLDSRYK